jgi:toxin FitB
MYLVDTNIISEARRKSVPVVNWFRSVLPKDIHISVISFGEIKRGIELIARKDQVSHSHLQRWFETIQTEYQDRHKPITKEISLEWGRISVIRTRSDADALIAATAIVHNLTLVTRNIVDFSDLPIKLINPWDR